MDVPSIVRASGRERRTAAEWATPYHASRSTTPGR
jgi:hypothetical protein